jgi:hypothetical protein
MPDVGFYMGCAAVSTGQIYCMGAAGGCNGDCGQGWDQIYDPSTNLWNSPYAPPGLPIGIEYSPVTVGADGRIYLINAGSGLGIDNFGGPTPTDLTYALTPGGTQWSQVSSGGIYRAASAAASGLDGNIYVFGGYDENGNGLSGVSMYDPALDAWSSVGSAMPTARGQCAAVTGQDGTIYVLGGNVCDFGFECNEVTYATVEAFDPTTQTWSTMPSMSKLRYALGAASGSDGRIYAVGGSGVDENGSVSQTAEAFDPAQGAWVSIANLNVARVGLQLVANPDGRLYALGGDSAGTVEVYTPGVDAWVP